MKKRIGLTSLLIGISLIILACSSDDQPQAKTKAQLLTSATWKVTAGAAQPCYADDTWTFLSNASMTQDNGSVTCNSGEPRTYPATWAFAENETILDVIVKLNDTENDTYHMTIVELTETTMKLKQGNVTITLTH